MTPIYVIKLGFAIRTTNVDAQKIDGSSLKIYGMATAGFLLQDRPKKILFFEKGFLLTDTNIKLFLRIHFFFSNTDIKFNFKEFL